jgi:hypothetical protein
MPDDPALPSTSIQLTPYTGQIGTCLFGDLAFIRGARGVKEPHLITGERETSYCMIVPLSSKSAAKVGEALMTIILKYRSFGFFIKAFYSDRDSVFIANEVMLNSVGAQLKLSSTGRHERRAERLIRTVKDRLRSLKQSSPYPWPLAFNSHAIMFIAGSLNLTPNKHTGKQTPREIIVGEKTSYKHLTTEFGQLVAVHAPKNYYHDDVQRGELGLVIGRDLSGAGTIKIFLLHNKTVVHRKTTTYVDIPLTKDIIDMIAEYAKQDPPFETDDIITTLDGIIEDDEPQMEPIVTNPPTDDCNESHDRIPLHLIPYPIMANVPAVHTLPTAPDTTPPVTAPPQEFIAPLPTPIIDVPTIPVIPPPTPPPTIMLDARPTRSTVSRIDYRQLNSTGTTGNTVDTDIYDEKIYALNMTLQGAIKLRGDIAIKAIAEEFKNMFQLKVIQAVHLYDIPKGIVIIPSHAFLKEKTDAMGNVTSMKARLVGGGNFQMKEEGDDNTSPTIRIQSVYILLNISAFEGRRIMIIDIKAAYLNAPMDSHQVYVKMRKDLVELLLHMKHELKKHVNKDGSIVYKVLKAMYGLVEAARLWYDHLSASLIRFGFTVCSSDRAVFKLENSLGKQLIGFHVDDGLVSSPNIAMENKLLEYLRSIYAGVNATIEPQCTFLSILINYDIKNKMISLSQPGYIDDILRQNHITTLARTPCTGSLMVKNSTTPIDISAHRSKMMQLSYLAGKTRPDLAFTVSVLITRLTSPTLGDEAKTNRMLSYVNSTKDLTLNFKPTSLQVIASIDASYAIHEDARSHYCTHISLGPNNAPFHFQSGVIKSVCRSSTEAELFAVNNGISDLLWAIDFMNELGYPQNTVPILEDNQSVIDIVTGPIRNYQSKSKHIRVRHGFIRQQIIDGIVKFIWTETGEMLADLGTKPIVGTRFDHGVNKLMNSTHAST